MSVAESKAKGTKKASSAETAAVKAALESAQMEFIPLTDLVISPLNVRSVPYPEASVRSLAETIKAAGLLQNLVVHSMPDGQSGVAAGGRRLTALNLLRTENSLPEDYRVAVKRVPEELATVVSFIENTEHLDMHPSEQIVAFRDMAANGMTASQIGATLGFGHRHVQRMLKLANLAPELVGLLAADKLSVEQCQALSLEDDQARQVEVYTSVKNNWSNAPVSKLKEAITETEINVKSASFMAVGREAYEAAGGVVREDLFSQQEGEGTADKALVYRLGREKAEKIAAEYLTQGWGWSLVRDTEVVWYGEDGKLFNILTAPDATYTDEEGARLDVLNEQLESVDNHDDENTLQQEIEDITEAAEYRAWTPELRAASGVVVRFNQYGLNVQFGIQHKPELPESEQQKSKNAVTDFTSRTPDAAEGITLPMLKKMSSERTLAVQAALMQQPKKAVALMVWRLCTTVFAYVVTTPHPFRLQVTVSHSSLTGNAPSGEEGKAWLALMAEKSRLAALLPEGWEKDFTTFFALDGDVLMSLMAFCTACSVDGVQTRDMGYTSRSDLDTLETAIGFHMRDWWQPTKANFLGDLKHAQIVEALNEAGHTGAALDAAKMKRGDAAEHAESWMKQDRWVPAWMTASVKPGSETVVTPEPDAKVTETPAETQTPAQAA